jgi:hypothetical protein
MIWTDILAGLLKIGIDVARSVDDDAAREVAEMLEATAAKLDAIKPLGPELDAVRDKHLARVRAGKLPAVLGPTEGEDPDQ